MVSASTSHSEAFHPSVTDDDYAQLVKLSTLHPIEQSNATTSSKIRLFEARTYAHRARLTQLFNWFRTSDAALGSFPELKVILQEPMKATEVFLVHDAPKTEPRISNTLNALSLMQGFNFRNPPRDMALSVVEEYRKVLRKAIDELNRFDQMITQEQMAKFGDDRVIQEKLETMIAVFDWYDTGFSRQQELNAKGSSLLKTSNWIFKLKRDGQLPEYVSKNFGLALNLAYFLDFRHPLASQELRFAQTEDFLNALPIEEAKEKMAILFRVFAIQMRTVMKPTVLCRKFFE